MEEKNSEDKMMENICFMIAGLKMVNQDNILFKTADNSLYKYI